MISRQKLRIAVGGILTECNHLGGLPIDMALYESSELLRGEELLEAKTSVLGGMVSTLNEENAEIAPLLFASACSAGPITEECFQILTDEFLERLEKMLPVEGVLLPLHGAALADGCDDPEGHWIREVRKRAGDIPIVVSLDLHAHVTAEMVRHADALVAWETYPHSDQFTTGKRATRLLLDAVRGKTNPTMAMAKVPVITSAVHGSTDGEDPFADLMRHTKSLEVRADVLSTSLFLIHPYMDVPDMGSGGLVVTDGNLPLAEKLASGIADRYWDRRHDLEPEMFAPADAIRQGMSIEGGPVLLVETADCCGGGAAGDSIATLSALIDVEIHETALVPVVDSEAAAACHTAGIGSSLKIALGHKLDGRWGNPRDISGRVEHLFDGEFTYSGGMWDGHREHMGPSAVFSIGAIKVLIMSRATYDWADEQWRAAGLNPATAKFIVAKNPMNYRHAYGDIMKKAFVLDTPGPTPATLRHVSFQKMQRPYFPADLEIEDLTPTVLS